MNLENIPREELELLSYSDLTEMILKESTTSMNTPSIFRKICDLLGLSDEEYQGKIGDYYTSLTTDKRFIHLENAEWDLKDRHKVEIIDYSDEEDEEYEDEEEASEENIQEDDSEENMDDELLDDNLDIDEDLEDLSIIDDENMDEE